MVAFDEPERLEAVGDEGVVAPVREQLGLSANQPGAADDEPAPRQAALGDLGDPLRRVVVQLLPALLRDALDCAADALVLGDADRIAGPVLLERGDRLVAPEARVGPHQQRAGRAETTQTRYELAHEPLRAALALRRPLAHARVQHLARVGTSRQDRVVATPLRVPETGALFGVSGDLDDRRVEVDRQRLRTRPHS